jgi:SP family galactose:H+ symporter-like MFS transporter
VVQHVGAMNSHSYSSSLPMVGRPATLYVILIAITAAVGGLLFGYDTAVISGAVLFVKQQFQLSPFETEIAVASVLAGCVVGAGVAGYFADRFGRKPVLLVNAVFFGAFAAATGMANSFRPFIAARFLVGLAVGVASMVTPLYIAEIAPARVRGALVTLNQLAIVIGAVTAYCVDYYFSGTANWRAMFYSAVAPSLIFLVALIFLPESPRWLASHGDEETAYNVLCRLDSPAEAQKYLADLHCIIDNKQLRFSDLFTARFRTALVIGLGLAIFDQITGINTITYYTPTILQMAGAHSASSAILGTVLVGGVNLLFTVLALLLLDRVGRRPLLLWSVASMALSLASLGYFFGEVHVSRTAILLSVLVYLASFAIGMGPIFWLLLSEIYPTAIRGQAMSLITVTIWIFDLLVAMTFLTLVNALGAKWTFWLYALASVAAFYFAFNRIPETKGRTLEEIEASWK